MSRRKSRELAMKLLFGMAINKQNYEEALDNLKETSEIILENMEHLKKEEKEDIFLDEVDHIYLKRVLKGVVENIERIDSEIEKYLVNWKISRLSKIDLTILRICTYEFLFEEDIPKNVSVNEAIELAKLYSEDKSSSFINGVLGNMIKNI